MSGSFSFGEPQEGLQSSILIENTVWDSCDQSTLTCIDDTQVISSDTINEHYITAQEDESGAQYFSVLGVSNDTILGDMGMVMDNSHIASASPETLQLGGEESNSGLGDISTNNQPDPSSYEMLGEETYVIQEAEDENGKLQRYQFKVRQNEHGQWEAVTGTIQLLSIEDEPEISTEQEKQDETPILTIKRETVQENVLPDVLVPHEIESISQLNINTDNNGLSSFEEQHAEDPEDVKAGILESTFVAMPHKQELVEEILQQNIDQQHNDIYEEFQNEEQIVEAAVEEESNINVHNIYLNDPNEVLQPETETFPDKVLQPVSTEDVVTTEEESEDLEEQPYEQVFIREQHTLEEEDTSQGTQDTNLTYEHNLAHENDGSSMASFNDSEDNEDYEIVNNGLHITGDTEIPTNNEFAQVESTQAALHFNSYEKEHSDVEQNQMFSKSNVGIVKNHLIVDRSVLKQFLENHDSSNGCNRVGNSYYAIPYLEKENVIADLNSASFGTRFQKSNPRSILKSSFQAVSAQKKQEPSIYDERIDRRFAKSKEATQARQLHNYIAKTTILHAPVRQKRLPRKQTIKPVKRQDEEIIVQEVVVSSNGFVEPCRLSAKAIKASNQLNPAESFNVSDSDEEYNPKQEPQKQRKKHKKRKSKIEIVISDSSEEGTSETSVIEVDTPEASSNDEDSIKKGQEEEPTKKRSRGRPRKMTTPNTPENGNSVLPKRKRGRPPKNVVKTSKDEESEDELEQIRREVESHLKETREKIVEHETRQTVDSFKTDIKCTRCPKKFSSQGSLRTHMQYHNFSEASMKPVAVKVATSSDVVNNYECKHCNLKFKNNALLVKHTKQHVECTVCKKVFSDAIKLSAHKRVHVKERMFKISNPQQMSPKSVASTTKAFKSPANIRKQFKCPDCSLVLPTAARLESHSKTHKKFTCGNCSKCFISKVLLDSHVRTSCVKVVRSPVNKRLSFRGAKMLSASASNLSRLSLVHNGNGTTHSARQGSSLEALKCDECSLTFATYTKLFQHKVVAHGLETPDKSVIAQPKRSSLCRMKQKHGGILANSKMTAAYANLKRLAKN